MSIHPTLHSLKFFLWVKSSLVLSSAKLIQTFQKIIAYNHHCARLEFGNLWESSPKFFSARLGGGEWSHFWGLKALQKWITAHRRCAVYKNFWEFENFWLKNAIKNNLGGSSQHIRSQIILKLLTCDKWIRKVLERLLYFSARASQCNSASLKLRKRSSFLEIPHRDAHLG